MADLRCLGSKLGGITVRACGNRPVSPGRYQPGIRGITPVTGTLTGWTASRTLPSVLIGVLGPLEVNGRLSGLGRRDRVVLEALAMRPHAVRSPDDLADALWPGQRPETWAKVVQGVIVRLRRLLGHGAVELVTGGYRLVVDDGDVDGVEFERLVERGQSLLAVNEPARALATYDDALRLWRGTPMDDLVDWPPGRDEARRLADIHGAAQEERLEAALSCGRAHEAVSEARRLVGEAPLRERRWQVLAAALYGAGRQAEALSALRDATRVLREDNGLDPSPMLGTLEQAILRQDATLPQARRVRRSSGVCPYPGLSSYQAGDSQHYVGREADVATCLRRLSEHPLLVVVGPSGCGKSSLVRAGVVPARQQRGQFMAVITPTPDPLEALARAREDAPRGAGLVVDQLEELAASEQDPGTARTFLDEVAAWTRRGPVVLAVRADHLADLAISPDLAELTDRAIQLLTPMSTTELRRVIEEPARKTGLVLEPGLVDLLLRDVTGEPGALPLLSHALRETWERREGDVLTVEGYLRTGGISGAVAQTADQVYDTLSEDQRAVLRGLMLRLVTRTRDGAPVSTHLSTTDVHERGTVAPVLRRLVASRLVTADDTTVAIAHESLATVWPRLRVWLDEDTEGRRILGHLQVAADGWMSAGCPPSELYRGARLQAVLEWRARTRPVLTADEDRFVALSVAQTAHDAERERLTLATQRRQNRRLRRSLGVAAVLLVLAVSAGATAATSERNAAASAHAAAAAARETVAARLGDAALIDPRADTSLLLARQAVALANTPQTSANLLAALDAQSDLQSVNNLGVVGFIGGQVQVSADGRRMLALQPDGVDLIDVMTGQRFPNGKPLVADVDAIYPAGFIDGGRTAVVSEAFGPATAHGRQCRLRYFAASSGLVIRSPERVPGARCEDFLSMDRPRITLAGRRLVSMSGTDVRIWERHRGGWAGPRIVTVRDIPKGQPIPRSITLTRDGSRAAIVTELAAAAPWYRFLEIVTLVDLDAGDLLAPPIVDPNTSRGVAIAPDGSRFAMGGYDGTIDVVPVGGGTDPLRLPGQSAVSAVAWSDDSAHLVVGRNDGHVQVVDARTGSLASSRADHGTPVATLASIGNGSRLLSMDDTGIGLVRDSGAPGPLGPRRAIPRPHAVAVGRDGTPIAVGLEDGRVQLYEADHLTRLPATLSLGPYQSTDTTAAPAIHRRVTALVITPDGRYLIAGNRAGHLRMWSLRDRGLVWSHDDVPVAFLAISPDGRYLATAEFTQAVDDPAPDSAPVKSQVRLRDLTDGRVVATWQTGTKKPRAVVFSPDSQHFLVGFFDKKADILAVPSAAPVAHLDETVGSAAFSPDGTTAVTVDLDGTVSLVNTRDWTVRRRIPAAAEANYTHLAFSPDGRFLFLANPSTTAIWDAHQYRPLVRSFSLPGDSTNDAIFLAVPKDRDELVLASQSTLTRLDLHHQVWEQAACDLAGRRLTQDEWTRVLPDQPYAPSCSK
jgi:WD40 repeat protein/DNA-binding SARP family transcriptional activator